LLTFFRLNDPYRLISIFILLFAIRLPFFLSDFPLLVPELNWMLIGEKMSAGNQLYTEIWDDIAPFSALLYWILDELFGRSQTAHHIISLLLVFIQAFIFNNIMLSNKVYNENSYVPALIYVISMNLYFDFMVLSPALMSLTFLLLAINNLFKRIDNKTSDEFFLNTGIFLGIAALFYLPSLLFFFSVVLSLAFFTGSILRRYLLLFYGAIIPIVIVWIYYYWSGGEREFLVNFFQSIFFVGVDHFQSLFTMVMIGLPPGLFLLASFLKLIPGKHFANYQVRFQYAMFFVLLMAILSFLFTKDLAPFQIVVCVPSLAFFIAHYMLLYRKNIKSELVFSTFVGAILIVNYGAYFNFFNLHGLLFDERLIVKEQQYDLNMRGKSVLVMGENLKLYVNAYPSTPYLEWDLAKLHFRNLDHYDNLIKIYDNLVRESPEIIVDLENIAPEVFERIPAIGQSYSAASVKNMYLLRKD